MINEEARGRAARRGGSGRRPVVAGLLICHQVSAAACPHPRGRRTARAAAHWWTPAAIFLCGARALAAAGGRLARRSLRP